MKLIIDIPEEEYKCLDYYQSLNQPIFKAIKNGIPLDTHDEEIIATTVESIWGKPPYTELLDKIRDDIKQDAFNDVNGSKYIFVNRVNQIIDKYRNEVNE